MKAETASDDDHKPPKSDEKSPIADKEFQIAIESFKALRGEIDLRLKNHIYLSISKIVACSTLLGHFLTKQDKTEPWTLVGIPILGVSLDWVASHNIKRVNDIGKYIRTELEAKFFMKLQGENKWEMIEHRAQTNTQGKSDSIDRYGQFFITFTFAILTFAIPAERSDNPFALLFSWSGTICISFVALLLFLAWYALFDSRASDINKTRVD